MNGAKNLDCSILKGKHLLSLDGTEEGHIECSCAGMVVLNSLDTFKTESLTQNENVYKIKFSNFLGGHSGTEINSNRQNAIISAFIFLSTLPNVKLIEIEGGGKSNAIPRDITIIFSTNISLEVIKQQADKFAQKLINFEPNAKIEVNETILQNSINSLSKSASKILTEYIANYENGVLVYSEYEKNFPIVSNNFANIKLKNGKLELVVSLRSSSIKKEEFYLNEILNTAKKHSINFEVVSTAPFFERKNNSYLQNLCVNEYYKLFNKKAIVQDVHAGLEGGVFAKKIPNLDICVIAPNLYDIHSPNEKVSISSVNRVYTWVEKILENF